MELFGARLRRRKGRSVLLGRDPRRAFERLVRAHEHRPLLCRRRREILDAVQRPELLPAARRRLRVAIRREGVLSRIIHRLGARLFLPRRGRARSARALASAARLGRFNFEGAASFPPSAFVSASAAFASASFFALFCFLPFAIATVEPPTPRGPPRPSSPGAPAAMPAEDELVPKSVVAHHFSTNSHSPAGSKSIQFASGCTAVR